MRIRSTKATRRGGVQVLGVLPEEARRRTGIPLFTDSCFLATMERWIVALLVLATITSRSHALVLTVQNTECVWEDVEYEYDIISGNFVVLDHEVFWGADHPGIELLVRASDSPPPSFSMKLGILYFLAPSGILALLLIGRVSFLINWFFCKNVRYGILISLTFVTFHFLVLV